MTPFHKRTTLIFESSGVELPPLPEYIAGYKIESLLSKGSMSLLYLALHPESREPITIKVLMKEYLGFSEMVERFLGEAEIIEMTDHPNIVKLFGHGRWEGGVYIAMEFVQGLSLREIILQQALSLRRAVEIVVQITHALAHLHTHGIIHRDLKPENILLTSQGGIKVVDFGIAALFKDQKKNGRKSFVGTPVYISPEQERDPRSVTFASDIYSLGVVAYELILGRLSHGVIHLGLIPKGLQKIVGKMLESDPKNRYHDVVDLMGDLNRYLASDEIQRDRRSVDFLGELSEDLKLARHMVICSPPAWPAMEIGLSSNANAAISTVYLDFFESIHGVYTVILGESMATGAEGIVQMALVKGMVRALAKEKMAPTRLVETLNELIFAESGDLSLACAFLTLYPVENRLSYIACGYSPLWYLPHFAAAPRRLAQESLALGISHPFVAIEMDANWHVGDKIVLHSFQASVAKSLMAIEESEETFAQALIENLYLSPKKQTEILLRKVAKEGTPFFQRSITVISIERTG